jgi:pilus assembly protein CpaB
MLTAMPPELIVLESLREVKGVEGKVARHGMKAREQILSSDLMMEGEIPSLAVRVPDGKRAIAIAASEVTAVGSVVKPGDHVDVLATYRDPIAEIETTQMLLQNVLVLAVNQGQTDPTTAQGAKTSMTLAVAPGETERLAAIDRSGALRVTLRSPNDPTIVQSPGVTLKEIAGSGDRIIPTPPPPPSPDITFGAQKPSPMPVLITQTNVPERRREVIIIRGAESQQIIPQ